MAHQKKSSVGTRWLLTTAALIIVLAGLRAAKPVLVPIVFAGFLTILGLPGIYWLTRHKVPKALAVVIVVLGIAGAVTAIGAWIGASIAEFAELLTRYRPRFVELGQDATSWLKRHDLPVSDGPLLQTLNPAFVWDQLSNLLERTVSALSNILFVLLTVTFMLLESADFGDKLRVALGERADVRRFTKIATDVQRYLVVKTGTAALTGILIAVWVTIRHLEPAWLWGLLGYLLNYIPVIGSIVASIPAILLSLAEGGAGDAAIMALGYVAINICIGNLLEPLLLGQRLGISPLVVFLSLVLWGWIWGPVGMLLCIPLTMIVKILMENSEDLRWIAILLDNKPRQQL